MAKTTKNKIVYEKNINELKGKALLIVFPDSIEEIENLVRASEVDIIARGAGTSFTGACVPDNSIIVDFSKMNKILDIHPSRKTAIVEPGVTVKELNEKLEEFGLEFPVESIFPGIETIGGLIAKNSSGNREIKYGRMINWIDSLEVITAKGERIKVSKSDLSDFAGLEGTTGLIVRVNIRLTSRKERSISVLKSENLNGIFKANKALRLDQYVSSIDFINKELSEMLGLQRKYHLFVEFEDNRGNFKGQDYLRFIRLKGKAYSKAAHEGFYILECAKIFSDSLQDFMLSLEERKIPYFSYLASGVVYCCFRPEDNEKHKEILNIVKRLRGEISYNLGIGLAKKEYVNNSEAQLISRIKKRHDPNSKFNQGKLIDFKPCFKIEPKIEPELPKEQEAVEVDKIIEEQVNGEAKIQENIGEVKT